MEYRASHKLDKDVKIYKVIGAYHAMRAEMDRRGWVEHDWEPKFDSDKFKSNAIHFIYSSKARDTWRLELSPHTKSCHFQG